MNNAPIQNPRNKRRPSNVRHALFGAFVGVILVAGAIAVANYFTSSDQAQADDQTPAAPAGPDVTYDSDNSFMTNVWGNPDQERQLALNAGKTVLVKSIRFTSDNDYYYTSGNGGVELDYAPVDGKTDIITCKLSVDDSKAYLSALSANNSTEPVVSVSGTISSFDEILGLVIDPCTYNILPKSAQN